MAAETIVLRLLAKKRDRVGEKSFFPTEATTECVI